MSQLWIVNEDVYIWANNEQQAREGFKQWTKDGREDIEIEKIEKIDDSTKLYLFTDEYGEKMWWWTVFDGSTEVTETNVREFFSEYCNECETPFIVYYTE